MDDDEILRHLDRPFRFWRCPEHRAGVVTWTGDRARCETCGQTNHPMDLPGVDRVLVLAGNLREFEAWVRENQPDRLYRAKAQWGETLYVYVCQRKLLMGHDPAQTRYLLVGRHWLKPELVREATSLYAPAGIPVLVEPNAGAEVHSVSVNDVRPNPASERVQYRGRSFDPAWIDEAQGVDQHQLDAIRYQIEAGRIAYPTESMVQDMSQEAGRENST